MSQATATVLRLPRERLFHHTPSSLSDAELVAAVLQLPPSQGLDPAEALLEECGGLARLPSLRPELLQRDGVGPARSAALLSAIELARRMARHEVPDRLPLSRPAALVSYLSLRYHLPDQEVVGALFLDARNRLLSEKELYRGTLSRALLEPRAVLKEGLLVGACSFVLFHTHPSGDPSPSLEDIAVTRRMAEAGETIGVTLADHLIVGGTGRWVSLKERGTF